MAIGPQTGMDRGEMRELLSLAKKQRVNCAVGQGTDGTALVLMDKQRSPRSLEGELNKKFPGVKNTRFGTVGVEGGQTVGFYLNKTVSGMAPRLIKTVKLAGFPKVKVMLEDGSAVEDAAEDAPAVADAIKGVKSGEIFKLQVQAAVQSIVSGAGVNVAQFTGLVGSACDEFKGYAEGRIKEIDAEITAGDLADGLFAVFLDLVGGELLAKVGKKLGDSISGKIGSAVAKKVVGDYKSKLVNRADVKSKSKKDLSDVLRSLVTCARDSAVMVNDGVTKIVTDPCQGIAKAVNEGKPLTQDQMDFLGPFFDNPGPEVVNARLESLGIPNTASAKKLYLTLYEKLVQAFEKSVYMASYDAQDRSVTSSRQQENEADEMAYQRAHAEREKKEKIVEAAK